MSCHSPGDKVAIVTGAAGGLGKVLVSALLGAGVKVAALDVDDNGLSALESEVKQSAPAPRFVALACDVSDYGSCESAVRNTVSSLGGLDILINNAALGMSEIRPDHFTRLVSITEITPDMWTRFAMTNFSGAWFMTRASIAGMLEQRWGRIINITTSFFTMLRGRFHPYGPCKAGIEAMSAGHAKELAQGGVTVNVVVPGGPTDTAMVPVESGFGREDLIAPEVMTPPILWLCSRAADAITGNRYVAADWDTSLSPECAEAQCRAPIAWPELAQSPVWPGGKPHE